jgi:NitT/TauT family transport system substrate-binding protein
MIRGAIKTAPSKAMKRIVVAAIAVVFAIMLVGSGAWPIPNFEESDEGKTESIIIGTTAQELNALIYIADDQSFFAANGLNITLKYFDYGRAAVNAMLKQDVDMATATEYVIVAEAYEGEKIRSIGSIARSQNVYLIARTDRGIHNVSDLKGKKIGFPQGSMSDFHTGRFLDLHGMSMQQVIPVDISGPQIVDAIVNGSVDAVLAWQPQPQEIQDRMGSRIVIWPGQSDQLFYWNVICADDWIANHPEVVNRLLKSLAQAEEYAISHPDESRGIVQKRLNYTDAYMATVWPENRFSLTLDQSLITAMEDEARWMIKNNLTSAEKIPDFQKYIYTKGLEEVKPDSVNIL